MTQKPLIEVQDLQKTYHLGDVKVPALRGVSFNVRKGEFVCVVGPSGSGKSTLFHILGGLTHPSAGKVVIDGRDLFGMSDKERTDLRRTKVGFVFQRYNLLPTLSAYDNIRIAQYLAGQIESKNGKVFKQVIRMLGIEHRLHHKPRALSGGEQQRVAIARAVVNDPAILLADEPTGNLDTENSRNVLLLLKELNQAHGQTILLITHDMRVATYGHRVLHMLDGRIVDEADHLGL